MATVAAQEALSSISRCTYQVFISFRGKDTRKHFTAHLYKALVQAGFHTFRDDDELETGEDIKLELNKAIHQSKVSVIVFSKDYASSGWCLDELSLILERKRTSKHVVVPIFYDVDPSHVRYQTGSIGESFARHEEKIRKNIDDDKREELHNKVKSWRKALAESANLSGMELKNQANGDEAKFIQKIVDLIRDKLNRKIIDVGPCLVGMPARTREINLWVQDESTEVGIMMICGMGGIGKTTIAKDVYNKNHERFDGSSFLLNIREMSKDPTGLVALQRQLLSDICKRNKEKMHNVDQGIIKIKEALCRKRVLIVLDDVDHIDQLYAVTEMRNWFFPGSKIIITTRHERLLKPSESFKVHKVENLNHEDSIKLFSLHAFGQDQPTESYKIYTKIVVDHFNGLPLALQVLGSSLCGKNLDIWASQIRKLETIADGDVIKKLRISYDSLPDDDIKNIFLHISCFFVGEGKDWVVEILDACDFHTVVGIDHLVDRCLLEMGHENKLMMHQLIRDMGKEIVRQESREPGRRSRIWHRKDIINVLREKSGTKKVEALVFEMQKSDKDESTDFSENNNKKRRSEVLDNSWGLFNSIKRRASSLFTWHPVNYNVRSSNEKDFETDAFARMQQLRLLKLNYVKLTGSYKDFPKRLRWLCWRGFPLASIPSELYLESLVHLDMQNTSLRQVWKGSKYLPSLKVLNLSHSKWLARAPDFRGVPNLEKLILKSCVSLSSICVSVGSIKGLVLLDVESCKSLRELPENLSCLRFLQTLNILGCSSLCKFPKWISELESLKDFYADGIGATALLSLTKELNQWPLPRSLVELSLTDCKLTDSSFPVNLGNLIYLKELNLSLNLIQTVPQCVKTLSQLETIDLTYCPELKSVVGLPSTVRQLWVTHSNLLEKIGSIPILTLYSTNCESLAEVEGCFKSVSLQNADKQITRSLGFSDLEFEEDIITEIRVRYEFGIYSIVYPGAELPGQFNISNRGSSSISWTVPSLSKDTRIRGLNVCFVYAYKSRDFMLWRPTSKLSNKTKDLTWRYTPAVLSFKEYEGDLIMLCHWKLGNLLDDGDEITFEITNWWVHVKELGIKIVYEEDKDDKEHEFKELALQPMQEVNEDADEQEFNELALQPKDTTYLSWKERNLFELSDFHESGMVYNLNHEIHFGEYDDHYKHVGWHGVKVSQ